METSVVLLPPVLWGLSRVALGGHFSDRSQLLISSQHIMAALVQVRIDSRKKSTGVTYVIGSGNFCVDPKS